MNSSFLPFKIPCIVGFQQVYRHGRITTLRRPRDANELINPYLSTAKEIVSIS